MGVQKDVFIREINTGRPPGTRLLDTCKHPGREPGEVCGACGEPDRPEEDEAPAGPVDCPACHRPFYEEDRKICRACGLDLLDIMEDE